MYEGDAEVGGRALHIAFLRAGEVGEGVIVGAPMQVHKSAIDVGVGICRLHEPEVRGVQGGVGAVGGACGVADEEDFLSVGLAGDSPYAVQIRPAREPSVDVGAVRSDVAVARVDDGDGREVFARVGEEVLDVRADTRADVGEGETLNPAARCAQSAEVVLLP